MIPCKFNRKGIENIFCAVHFNGTTQRDDFVTKFDETSRTTTIYTKLPFRLCHVAHYITNFPNIPPLKLH